MKRQNRHRDLCKLGAPWRIASVLAHVATQVISLSRRPPARRRSDGNRLSEALRAFVALALSFGFPVTSGQQLAGLRDPGREQVGEDLRVDDELAQLNGV
ncbi:hypothetical protein [Methylobacterium tarhaniae]|uniref:hypothetical protein n=1 Tax=Methylobacterium tarhaniae TaxID=1187852 RepID=UPI003D02BD79